MNGTVVVSGGSAAGRYAYVPANGDSIRCVATYITRCGDTFVVSSNTVNMVTESAITPAISLSGLMYVSVGSMVTVNATVAGAGSGYSIHWYNHDTLIGTTTTPTFTYSKTWPVDSITATVVPVGGCYDSTLSGVHLVVDSVLAISSFSPSGPLHRVWLYPNPAFSELHVVSAGVISLVEVMDLVGKVVIKHAGSDPLVDIGIASLPPGLYFVRVDGIVAGKFMKE